jgi:hypothetical protein
VRVGQVEMIGRDGKSTSAKAGDKLELSAGRIALVSRTPIDQVPATLDTIRVLIKGGAGAEIKPKGGSRWRKVAAKGETLEDGMSLRTSKSPARLLMGSARSSVEVGPASEVLFTAAGQRADREQSTFDLKRGRLTHIARKGPTSVLTLQGVTVGSDGTGDRYEIKRAGSGYEVEAVAGDLVVSREGKNEPIAAGVLTHLRPGKAADAAPLDTSLLRLGARGGQRIFHPGLPEVTLAWPGEAGDYAVEVAEDSKFEQVVLQGKVHAPQVTVPAPRKGTLFWRARNAAGEEARWECHLRSRSEHQRASAPA